MIIVSQDKELIINLNNVIGIQKDGKRIGAVFVNGDSLTLAEYRTEERAKEVLQDIVRRNARFAIYRTAPTGGREQTEMIDDFIENKIIFDSYEMPEA